MGMRAGEKERGAREAHKRLLNYFNVNRTSLDHLLLGGNADGDRMSRERDYSAGSGRCQPMRFLNLLSLVCASQLPTAALLRHVD